jgi:ribosome-binding protein aMBF1 (putative translation factor)
MASKKIIKPKVLQNAIPSFQWKKREDYKKENRGWLRKSISVALTILEILEERKMSQTELAEKLKVSRQHVGKILKGQENLTIETICKLEEALGIKLGSVLDGGEPTLVKTSRTKK